MEITQINFVGSVVYVRETVEEASAKVEAGMRSQAMISFHEANEASSSVIINPVNVLTIKHYVEPPK